MYLTEIKSTKYLLSEVKIKNTKKKTPKNPPKALKQTFPDIKTLTLQRFRSLWPRLWESTMLSFSFHCFCGPLIKFPLIVLWCFLRYLKTSANETTNICIAQIHEGQMRKCALCVTLVNWLLEHQHFFLMKHILYFCHC